MLLLYILTNERQLKGQLTEIPSSNSNHYALVIAHQICINLILPLDLRI